MSVDIGHCPRCESDLTTDPRFVVWCPGCDWNVDPSPPEPPRRLTGRLSQRIDRSSLELFEQLSNEHHSELGKVPPSPAIWILALMTHATTIALVGGAVVIALLGTGLFLPLRVVLVITLLVTAAYVQPFQLQNRKSSNLVGRDDAPELFALIDEIAEAVGAPTVEAVGLNTAFNASYARAGPRKSAIWLGLVLWSILEPEEKVAVLGHELGHRVNGDLRSKRLVARALATLRNWNALVQPSAPATSRSRTVPAAPIEGVIDLAERVILGTIFLPITVLAQTMGTLLTLLANQHGQRSEYYADELAARVAGTDATARLAEKLLIGDACSQLVIRTLKFGRDSDPWEEVKSYPSTIPPTEWERRRRVGRIRLQQIDATHPPSQFRSDFLRSRPCRKVAVDVTASRSEAIDAELAPYVAAVTRSLRDSYPPV